MSTSNYRFSLKYHFSILFDRSVPCLYISVHLYVPNIYSTSKHQALFICRLSDHEGGVSQPYLSARRTAHARDFRRRIKYHFCVISLEKCLQVSSTFPAQSALSEMQLRLCKHSTPPFSSHRHTTSSTYTYSFVVLHMKEQVPLHTTTPTSALVNTLALHMSKEPSKISSADL